jgi:LacI family gluconate utilization system Gnt-I transcriptional repressor
MTEAILSRSPDLDFLYYSNDMIGAGGLLWLLERGVADPRADGAGGLQPDRASGRAAARLATMDACRREIGLRAARIVAARRATPPSPGGERVELTPTLERGDTLR